MATGGLGSHADRAEGRGTASLDGGVFDVEVDVTCDTFGGTEDALEQVLSDVPGREVARPSGEFVIDGTAFSLVDRRSCLVGSDGKAQVDLALEGPDGTPAFLLLEGTDDRQYARLTGVPGQEVWEFGGANQLYHDRRTGRHCAKCRGGRTHRGTG